MKNKRTRWWFTSLFLIVVFFCLALISFIDNEPWTIGDGYEYVLQTAAFQNHLSFGMTVEDLSLAQTQFPELEDLLQNTFNSMAVAKNGLSYSNHFGIYSALVIPAKLILLALNINPIYAFRITNLLLWFGAALVILFFLKADDRKKFAVLTLILFNPVFFYLTWIHTELFIFSFAVIGLVFYYNKNYSLGILFVSIGAMQNLGLIPLGMIIGLEYIWNRYVDFTEKSQSKNLWHFVSDEWIRIIPYGFFYVPAMLPMITCYLHFGVVNRVAAVAGESHYLFSRAKDYLIDLNLGILPYEPIILVVFFVLVIYGIVKRQMTAFLNLLAVCGMLFIISFEIQINCGMEAIMRYNVWILPCMLFYVAMNLSIERHHCKYACIIGSEVVFTTFMVVYTLWGCSDYRSYLQFAPWTKVILDKYPQLYNPCHGIFYSRAGNGEAYYYSTPVAYCNEDGYLRKILLSKEAEEKFYNDSYKLFADDGNVIDKSTLKKTVIDEGDYAYINTVKNITQLSGYKVDEDIIYFYTDKYNAKEYVKSGLSVKEDWGSWTDGDELVVKMYTEDDSSVLHCYIDVATTFYQPQNVIAYVNDKKVYDNVVSGNQDIEFDFINDDKGLIQIKLELPDSISPADVIAESDDNRVLGLGLLTMQISECD